MDSSDLLRLLHHARDLRIGVVGDFCLDAYLVLDPRASESSVETGLPTHPVRSQRYSLGGAGNVAANLRAMGVREVPVYGVIGCDPFAKEMCALFDRLGIPRDGLQTQADEWQTHVYVKPLENDREGNRIDFGNYNVLHPDTAGALLQSLERALPGLQAVIINEQVLQGLHTPAFRSALRELIRRHPAALFIADARHFSDEFDGAVRKINLREAARLAGVAGDGSEALSASAIRRIAQGLFERWQKQVFISLGEYGCVLHGSEGVQEVPGLLLTGPIDPVGAGDSLLAGIAAGLAAGASALDAAELGTFVAGVTLQKLFQTGTASPEEILAIGSDPHFRYRPELARHPSSARYVAKSEIEIVTALPSPGTRFTHCIFDHDGTVSTLRQGWEEIMEPMMIRAILGDREQEVDEGFHDAVVDAVRKYIDRTTG
ncbi:MAG TPA: PfkB family carbohydrate kinase, partial [Bacteroidota bacterium]